MAEVEWEQGESGGPAATDSGLSPSSTHACNFDRILFSGGMACTICDAVETGWGGIRRDAMVTNDVPESAVSVDREITLLDEAISHLRATIAATDGETEEEELKPNGGSVTRRINLNEASRKMRSALHQLRACRDGQWL